MPSRFLSGRAALRVSGIAALAAAAAYGLVFFIDGESPGKTRALGPTAAQAAKSTGAIAVGAVSGLPLPRYVSLKASEVNVRRGAGKEHEVMWTYQRSGLPVEIIGEWDNWRRIRDSEGANGWVFHSLLSGKRTAQVAPWSDKPILPLLKEGREDAELVAQLQPKVMANVSTCTGEWCRITGDGFDGWMKQDQLFGVYPGEIFN